MFEMLKEYEPMEVEPANDYRI
jgi:hypothetical protein